MLIDCHTHVFAYPFTPPEATVEALRNFNKMVEGTNLPRLEPHEIDLLIGSPALRYLGLEVGENQ